MKTKLKRVLASVLTTVMLLTLIPFAGMDFTVKAASKAIEDCSVGEIIEFGSYPQSKVTDSETIAALDAIDKEWISYGYYSGTGERDGTMHPTDYVRYCDIIYNGNKYRAVYAELSIPMAASGVAWDNPQFFPTKAYYLYEPLTWQVLDPNDGFVMCNEIIDCQPFNNYTIFAEHSNLSEVYWAYGNPEKSYLASEWINSSLRTWLNNVFLQHSFFF